MVVVKPENVVKKIDDLGRITIPKSLRARMYINSENNQMEFFTAEIEGKDYILLAPYGSVDGKYLAAAEVLKELGAEIPTELQEVIEG
jgi:bifunctional DNA-binding transcriptional regulator/antitoxin component of YhaV-PrlF toxin-antitoxin module